MRRRPWACQRWRWRPSGTCRPEGRCSCCRSRQLSGAQEEIPPNVRFVQFDAPIEIADLCHDRIDPVAIRLRLRVIQHSHVKDVELFRLLNSEHLQALVELDEDRIDFGTGLTISYFSDDAQTETSCYVACEKADGCS